MRVAVVGAGPAGLIVATLLAQRGESVTLIDEHFAVGGHLTYDQYETGVQGGDSGAWLTELRAALTASPVKLLRSAVAWAAFRSEAGMELAVNRSGSEERVVVDIVVVAAGTTDRPLVAPGATLPGVMTSRAIRILLTRHHVIPGQRLLIVGGGAEAERLRDEVIEAGCDVAAVVSAKELSGIGGVSGVESVSLRDGAVHEVDIVAVARGEVPDAQLAGMLEVPRIYDAALGGWRPSADDRVHAVGGSLLGPASPSEIVRSATAAADQICHAGPGLRDCGLSMTDAILQAEVLA